MIRPAVEADLGAITAIYNHYIVDSYVSFDCEPWTLEQRYQWWRSHYLADGPWLVFVCEIDGEVVGATWSSRYRPKQAYNSSVETTIVLKAEMAGRGLGLQLYGRLLDSLDARPDVHRQYAVVVLPNPASVALHHRVGFETLSIQDEVGYKMGRYWSTMLLQRASKSVGS